MAWDLLRVHRVPTRMNARTIILATDLFIGYCASKIEKDTLHFGPRLEELIERLASLKKGQVMEDDVHQEFGYRAGMWHVPSAVSHFKAMLAVAVIRKNAALIREHCVRSAQNMDRV